MVKVDSEPENEAEPARETDEVETVDELDEVPSEDLADIAEVELELGSDEESAEEEPAIPESEPEQESDEALVDEDSTAPDPPPPPEEILHDILETARAVMGDFTETRPDDYVARLEASSSEWMTITDDSLSNELERELITSAAAMCLLQEWMIWYQGERTSAFTDALGKIGPVFVRGQAGQWTIVSRLRSILRQLWT